MAKDLMKELIHATSKMITDNKEQPPADPLDLKNKPFGIRPGDNKFGFRSCPFCLKPPTPTNLPEMPLLFMFRDILSVTEHRISGLCQSCQDRMYEETKDEVS